MEFKAVPRTIADTLDLKRKYVIPRFQREYHGKMMNYRNCGMIC